VAQESRPQAENIMVEPDPNCLAAGRSNFARNRFVGEFIQAAVSRGAWQVDQFLRSRRLHHVDILHVDIQGFEVEMMDGARDALRNARINYLFISTHSQQIHHEIIRRLEEVNYRVEVASDVDYETLSCDGLVFASSPRAKALFTGFNTLGRAALATSRPDDVLQALEKVRHSVA
jgi:hypothetical protein